MTPLFIETQSTLVTEAPDQSTLRERGVSSSDTSAQLRMTVDVHNFTATQADGQMLYLLDSCLSYFLFVVVNEELYISQCNMCLEAVASEG